MFPSTNAGGEALSFSLKQNRHISAGYGCELWPEPAPAVAEVFLRCT